MKTSLRLTNKGSALIYAILAILVLTMGAAEVMRLVSNKYLNTFHAASWQEALIAAESGVDLAIVQLRKNIQTPGGAWDSPWVGTAGGALSAYSLTTVNYAGEGGTRMTMSVSVDAPASLVDSNGWQYYRIRSIGSTAIPGPARSGNERRDLDLRKLSLRFDRYTGARVASPQASRKLEIIARPISAFDKAQIAKTTMDYTDQNIVIDSYDSTDPLKSTDGQWDISKRLSNGSIATDGTLISAGNAQVYGDAATNNGSVTGLANVTGEIRDDFYRDLPSFRAPTWTIFNFFPSSVTTTATLASSAIKGVARYKLSTIALSGGEVLTITGDPSATTYVEIWVTGDIRETGNAQILIDKNVIATIYAAGDVEIGGNGITNGNGTTDARPSHLLIYGIQPTDGTTPVIKLAGNANIEAAVYAPDAAITINGGGSRGSYSGSVVGKSIRMTGVTRFHYDESLDYAGMILDYKIASWFEDTR